jgi:F0F1-type ATP synthase assembly protein I
MPGDNQPAYSQWAIAAQASSTLIGPVVIGLVLDSQLGWTPWATVTGILIGFVGCITLLIQASNRGDKPGG